MSEPPFEELVDAELKFLEHEYYETQATSRKIPCE